MVWWRRFRQGKWWWWKRGSQFRRFKKTTRTRKTTAAYISAKKQSKLSQGYSRVHTSIKSAIPKLSRLLFSKTQTDVLEVISFFVTCYEHGLTDMVFGIRKMLSLVLYAEKTIKDAVVSAYKRLYLKKQQ